MNRSIFLLLIVLTSCTSFFKKKSERILARVHDEYLYESDLQGIFTPGQLPKDSLEITKSFIENWVRQKLIIHQAEKNLTKAQMDFSRQLENYKNSLIIYEYENALVKQNLDTLITDDEIQTYYDENQFNFLLKDNIVQIQYVKVLKKSGYLKQFRKLLSADESQGKDQLSELCEKHSSDYFLDDHNWLLFNDLLKQIPIKTYNQEEFLKNHRTLEFQDSLYTYLVKFKDFKIKESVSPLSFESQRIRSIILNKRKIELINRLQDDIYSAALKKNDFEIY